MGSLIIIMVRLIYAFVFLPCLAQFARSWTVSPAIRQRPSNIRLHVVSKESQATEESTEDLPYVVARGDGMTGGGGLPMPKATEEEEGLARPKVGAEMPKGRPSWFKVPAPSEGRFTMKALDVSVI